MKLLIVFIILNIVNVIIQTAKSICTIKCGKVGASLVNAIAYGLYTIVIVYTMCDLPLALKAIIVALCNLIGVYVVKLIEEKARKDKLWKIEMTIPRGCVDEVELILNKIPHSKIEISNKYVLLNFYCATQTESEDVKQVTSQYKAKYFVSESKEL